MGNVSDIDIFFPFLFLKVYLEEVNEGPCPALPKPDLLARQANRLRQRMRPAEPTDLDFHLEEDHIPADFLKGDVEVKDRRHLIFAAD